MSSECFRKIEFIHTSSMSLFEKKDRKFTKAERHRFIEEAKMLKELQHPKYSSYPFTCLTAASTKQLDARSYRVGY